MNNQRILFLEGLKERLIQTAIKNNQRLKELQMNENKNIGEYSRTTMRHIKEFLKQNGFKVDNTKQVLRDYGELLHKLR